VFLTAGLRGYPCAAGVNSNNPARAGRRPDPSSVYAAIIVVLIAALPFTSAGIFTIDQPLMGRLRRKRRRQRSQRQQPMLLEARCDKAFGSFKLSTRRR